MLELIFSKSKPEMSVFRKNILMQKSKFFPNSIHGFSLVWQEKQHLKGT